jgi:hydroxymethylbilane synthase
MVLPLRDVPSAPAQGALAIEAPIGSRFTPQLDAICHRPTWDAVQRERAVLVAYGGGCHVALGATALPREYGWILSIQAAHEVEDAPRTGWSLETSAPTPRANGSGIWPRPDERATTERRSIDATQPPHDAGLWVARAEAVPEEWSIPPEQLVWTAGGVTWRKLAARGIWVNGCADGLGDSEPANVDLLAGRTIAWRRLTHRAAATADPSAVATYVVDEMLPADLRDRMHFFWTSPTLFLEAVERWPELKVRSHGSGPGRTWQTIHQTLGDTANTRVWLDYDHWHREIL